MSWDDPLLTSLRNEWAKIVNDLQNLSKIQIPHYVNTERDGTEEYQLICFCDASGKAFATAVYIRVTGPHSVKANLIFTKARVAPKEELTLPHLELLGTLIGKRSTHFGKNISTFQLQKPFYGLTCNDFSTGLKQRICCQYLWKID